MSVPGACTHVALVGRCPTAPGEIAVLKADAETYGWKLGSRIDQPEYQQPFTVVGIYTARPQDEGFWFGPRLQTAPGRALPTVIPSRPAPWITTQAGIELTSNTWFVTVDQSLHVTPELTPDDAAAAATRVRALGKAQDRGDLLHGPDTRVRELPAGHHAPAARPACGRPVHGRSRGAVADPRRAGAAVPAAGRGDGAPPR